MEIHEKNMKLWSRIGSRAAFGLAALELGGELDDLMILTPDTSTSAGLDRFRKTYPEKYLEIGIAEQNMMGIAAGLASEGIKVITSTFSPFQTMRCCDQIRVNLGYMNHDVCMVGLASGLVLGSLGYTHCCIEDLAIMRAIPGLTVISPADSSETVKSLFAVLQTEGPVYMRLTGGTNNPMVYQEDYKFEIGKAIRLRKGSDITIFATGTMVYNSLKAAELLENDKISTSVVNVHTIKPVDRLAIEEEVDSCRLIVTVEEHSVIGGLGSVVAEVLAGIGNKAPMEAIGVPDKYGDSGSYSYLLQERGLTAELIAARVKNKLYDT